MLSKAGPVIRFTGTAWISLLCFDLELILLASGNTFWIGTCFEESTAVGADISCRRTLQGRPWIKNCRDQICRFHILLSYEGGGPLWLGADTFSIVLSTTIVFEAFSRNPDRTNLFHIYHTPQLPVILSLG